MVAPCSSSLTSTGNNHFLIKRMVVCKILLFFLLIQGWKGAYIWLDDTHISKERWWRFTFLPMVYYCLLHHFLEQINWMSWFSLQLLTVACNYSDQLIEFTTNAHEFLIQVRSYSYKALPFLFSFLHYPFLVAFSYFNHVCMLCWGLSFCRYYI